MYFADLQSFIAQLDDSCELRRIKNLTDPNLEAAKVIIHECEKADDNKALLFERMKGSKLSLAANLFGSEKRTAMALGVTDIEALVVKFRQDLKKCTDQAYGPALASVIREAVTKSACYDLPQYFTEDSNALGLEQLPALQSWPCDGGRYLTLAQVFTRPPDSNQQNCGMYRVQIIDGQSALIRFHPGSGGGKHMANWHARGEAMPVAIVLGGPPALTWCAGVPLPEDISEYDFVSYISGQSIPVARGQFTGLHVPATAEIVIEGEIKPGEQGNEGPFANHTGYYTPASPAPVVQVRSVQMRSEAVYPCTVVGPPPKENMYLAKTTHRLLLPLLQHVHPWLIDIHMPLSGIYHRGAYVTVDTVDLSLQELSVLLRKSPLLRHSRLLVILDKGNDLRDAENTYWRVINADDWPRTVLINDNQMTIDARRSSEKVPIQ